MRPFPAFSFPTRATARFSRAVMPRPQQGSTAMKQTAVTFRQAKGQRKLAMLTAYDATVARLMDDHVDAVLVGDSLGMVMLGQPDTLSVTMDQMIHHSAAVSRGLTKPLLVCDMPFMSYHLSPQQACANAGRLVQEGRAQAVKLEGGRHFCPSFDY